MDEPLAEIDDAAADRDVDEVERIRDRPETGQDGPTGRLHEEYEKRRSQSYRRG